MPEGALATATAPEPRWDPPQLDVPTRGRPMSARVEAVADAYRRLTGELMRSAGAARDALGQTEAAGSDERAARSIAGIVAIRSAIEGSPARAGESLRWFLGDNAPPAHRRVEQASWDGPADARLVALLPYVLDPFGPTTRRALLAGRACPDERASRKQAGAFYTPGDVARTLVTEVVTSSTRAVLDPACGAGVFLRAAFTRLASTFSCEQAVACLHGTDIDAAALDACALVLTHDWLMRDELSDGETPLDRFRQVRSRLTHANALSLFARSLSPGVPPRGRLAGRAALRFDAILTNPPFAPVGPLAEELSDAFASLRTASNPAGLNMAWPFWELVSRAATDDGRVGIVLPLSCAYLTGEAPRAARRVVFERGTWDMRFFDRAPDALFGDDVKQRIALAIRRPGAAIVRATRMRRWSSDNRARALSQAGESIELDAPADLVLKVGSSHERDAIDRLRSLSGTLGQAAVDVRLTAAGGLDPSECAIAVAPTAYNWIGAYRDNAIAHEARRAGTGKLLELVFADVTLADAAYATLASHVFLWWWRATGDLFHVSRSAVANAPFPLHLCTPAHLSRVAAAGRACWKAAQVDPITSVNKGVVTVAYTPAADHEAVAAVDFELGAAFGLGARFVRFVREDAARLREAGRGN